MPLDTIGVVYPTGTSRMSFKGDRAGVPFHVHVVESNAKYALDQLMFRDNLQDHQDEAARYAALKQTLVCALRGRRRVRGCETSYVHEIIALARKRASENRDRNHSN